MLLFCSEAHAAVMAVAADIKLEEVNGFVMLLHRIV
jgi:hypothetical protein